MKLVDRKKSKTGSIIMKRKESLAIIPIQNNHTIYCNYFKSADIKKQKSEATKKQARK